jgi:hypothetical protein
MSHRHLRIYYIDAYGHEIDRGPICSAVMPKFKMPMTRLPASRYTGPSHVHRRNYVAMLVLNEARRAKPKFHGIVLIVCPGLEAATHRSKRGRTPGHRPSLVPTNAYLGSFAAVAPTGQVVAGDVMLDTLTRAYKESIRLVHDILTRKPGEEPARGASA